MRFVVVCFLDIDECAEGEGRTSCGEKTCVNVPGSFRCEPKETEKIKPVFQGESMEFYSYSKSCLVTEQKGVIFVVFFRISCRSCYRFGTVVLGSWDMGTDQIR